MKTPFMQCLLVLAMVSIVPAQQTAAPPGTRVPTATRLVVTFQNLERQLRTAVQKKDEATLDRLLADDFEVWTPEPAGEPIPRAEWLQKDGVSGTAESFSIRDMAVKGLDDHALASFVLLEGSGAKQTAQFVVDLWSRSGKEWKLTDRYAAPVPATKYLAEPKPTGKD